jgi:hypothetical protein
MHRAAAVLVVLLVAATGAVALGAGPLDGQGETPTSTPESQSPTADASLDDRDEAADTSPTARAGGTATAASATATRIAGTATPETATPADSDGDGLSDSRERDLGTDPTVADTDGDGLADGREVDLGTDPLAPDSDADGLADGRERVLGTNATLRDTDGDGLADGAEVAGVTDDGADLPDADPLAKDLYVQVDAAANADQLTDAELADIADAWAAMPVDNPDGSEGVDLHSDRGHLAENVTVAGDDDYREFLAEYDSPAHMGDRSGVYHLVVVAAVEGDTVGRAPTPGTFAVVDGSRRAERGGTTVRSVAVVHELLHNVVGTLDERNRCPAEFDGASAAVHTCEGWLSYDSGAQFLPESVAAELEADGLLKG